LFPTTALLTSKKGPYEQLSVTVVGITWRHQYMRKRNIRVTAEGWFARIMQHEIDHLDGILFIDRLDSPEDLKEVVEGDEGDLEENETVMAD
jgi:peptide deformylase